jgi:hypothetical protein
LGCRTVLASWNHHSGNGRRQALQAQEFTSVSNDRPLPDGGFGMSFPYAKRIPSVQCDSALDRSPGIQGGTICPWTTGGRSIGDFFIFG